MRLRKGQQIVQFGIAAVGIDIHAERICWYPAGTFPSSPRKPWGSMWPASSVRKLRIRMPRAAACNTVVVVTHPASACSKNSTGLAPSFAPSNTGGSPLVNSNGSSRDWSSWPVPSKPRIVDRLTLPSIQLFLT
jgi:hypothetical protein